MLSVYVTFAHDSHKASIELYDKLFIFSREVIGAEALFNAEVEGRISEDGKTYEIEWRKLSQDHAQQLHEALLKSNYPINAWIRSITTSSSSGQSPSPEMLGCICPDNTYGNPACPVHGVCTCKPLPGNVCCPVHGSQKTHGLATLKNKYGERVQVMPDGTVKIWMTEFEGRLQAEVEQLRIALGYALKCWGSSKKGCDQFEQWRSFCETVHEGKPFPHRQQFGLEETPTIDPCLCLHRTDPDCPLHGASHDDTAD